MATLIALIGFLAILGSILFSAAIGTQVAVIGAGLVLVGLYVRVDNYLRKLPKTQ